MPQTASALVIRPANLPPPNQGAAGSVPPVIQNYGAPTVFLAQGPITPRP
jgi:hypothetical protein